MIRDFSKEEWKLQKRARDTELTLGRGTLRSSAAGCLVLLCVVCLWTLDMQSAIARRSGSAVSNVAACAECRRPSVAPVGFRFQAGRRPGQTPAAASSLQLTSTDVWNSRRPREFRPSAAVSSQQAAVCIAASGQARR